MEYLLLIIGFVLLIKGADFFVDGSSSLARFLKIPSVIIGLTIVAMGTSAPEASVSINAALAGNNDIAVSNVIGSNIFNGLVVVGICAFISAFKTNKDILKRDMPVNILITLILCIMIADGKLSRIEGFLLLAGMIFYILNMIHTALKKRNECSEEQTIPLYKALIFIDLSQFFSTHRSSLTASTPSVDSGINKINTALKHLQYTILFSTLQVPFRQSSFVTYLLCPFFQEHLPALLPRLLCFPA